MTATLWREKLNGEKMFGHCFSEPRFFLKSVILYLPEKLQNTLSVNYTNEIATCLHSFSFMYFLVAFCLLLKKPSRNTPKTRPENNKEELDARHVNPEEEPISSRPPAPRVVNPIFHLISVFM